ncbi:21L [Yaba monkey tumor virus]|uniref:21L n=1 Tax=Yaba monkey tumor virus (strain VR587) TaxID=928314 RepID=Q6TUZ1_YMTV5|nr:putative transmembrane protein [Yaba monkey tumor virus]AAR07378.1 21L [Yaba monkey tumor virus]
MNSTINFEDSEFGANMVMVISVFVLMISFLVFMLLYLIKWSYVMGFLNDVKIKIMNMTTRRSFAHLDDIYYTSDDVIGLNVE